MERLGEDEENDHTYKSICTIASGISSQCLWRAVWGQHRGKGLRETFENAGGKARSEAASKIASGARNRNRGDGHTADLFAQTVNTKIAVGLTVAVCFGCQLRS